MKQLQGSKAAAKLFSPAALALAVGLACWGSAALAYNEPIPGVDIIVKKNPGDSIVVTPTSDHAGKFSVKLGPGDYTVSTACKSGGCTPSRISIDIKDYNETLEADGSTSYEFHVGKGGLNLRGQTLSIDLSKGAGANGPASTTVKLQQPPPNQLREGVLPVPGDYDEDGVETRKAAPKKSGTHLSNGALKAGVPPPVDEADQVGPPVKVQLRNVDTGALAGTIVLANGVNFPDKDGLAVTTLSSTNGEFTFSGLSVGNYVVEIVDAAGKIIGTSASIAVGVGSEGKVGGNLMKGSDGEMMIFDRWGNLIANPNNGGDGELPGKKHNYKGVVTLVRGTVPNPDSGKESGGDGQNKVWQLMQGQTGAVAADPSSGEGDDLPGKKHNYVGSVTLVRGTAPNADSGDEILPSTVTPIQGTPVGLEGDPEGVRVSTTTTDEHGAFNFSNVSAGNYKLKLPGLPDQSVIVGPEGKVGGNLMKGSDGELMIFDRWGNLIVTPITVEGEKFKVTNDREKMSIAAPNNGGDKTLADKLPGKGADALKGIPIPHNDDAGGITVPPPKIRNDKPVMEGPKNSPGGFGDGMGGSPGRGPDIGGMGGGPNPGMMSPPGGMGSGPVNPMSGGPVSPMSSPGAMSPGGPGGPGSPMHP